MKILLTLALLVTSLGGVAAGMSSEAMIDPNVSPLNYTDGGFLLQGFLAVPETANPLPAVVIIPDWDGVNFYEQQRATMIAQELGYVGFAADIYGMDKHEVSDIEERSTLAGLYRENATLFFSRIEAAIQQVKTLDEVDSDNVAAIGYCFGGTGVITYGLLGGNGVKGLVSFHGGLTSIPEAGPVMEPKLLVLSGGQDDTATEVYDLEQTLDEANSTWEVTRYSGIEHAFTKWDDDRYNEWADRRSWESMTSFLQELFGEVPFDGMEPEEIDVDPIDYTDVDGAKLRGYLSLPENDSGVPSPAVVILPDWDGVNEYEQKRATLLAESGYVAFAADIFGKDLQTNLTMDQRINLTTTYRSDPDLFTQRIQRAIDEVKQMPEVDSDKIGLIGYCFGGTGIIEYAFTGRDDVKIVVSFHGGLQTLPQNQVDIKPYVLILSGGVDDANGNQTILEMSLDNATADWEVTRYANVDHGFTKWDSSAYTILSDARSWDSMMLAFEEFLPMVSETMTSSTSLASGAKVVSLIGALLVTTVSSFFV
jgi:dienelactone hydrolase